MTTFAPPICVYCERYRREEFACTAFPERLPDAIMTNAADHRLPYPGDQGQQFVARVPEGVAYADHLFGPLPTTPPAEPV